MFSSIPVEDGALGRYGGLNKPKETAAYLSDVVKKSGYSAKDFFTYSATGSNDAVFEQVDNQMREMLRLQMYSRKRLSYTRSRKAASATSRP